MPIRAGENRGLGSAAKLVSERASSLVRLEIALAAAELKRKAGAVGVGIGLLIGAVLFALYGLGFGFASAASGLSNVVPMWAALLIVTGALFLIAAILGLIGKSRVQQGVPPAPQQAIEEAKLTAEALKNGHH
jgi:Putative Actinobacterial Holin-X, holin superfamily III